MKNTSFVEELRNTRNHLLRTEKDILPLLKAIVNGMYYDPGHSDLDDEQPMNVSIPLGAYRLAKRLLYELEHEEQVP
jgi:hypothetical protein